MAHWLFKSEPEVFGWDHLVAKGVSEWDGVRNYQARNFMRDMAVGDTGFFYHSRTGLEIVGIMTVMATAHPDSTADDDKWVCVDVKADRPLPRPVTLDAIKAEPALSDMVLVRNSRLSVQPVTPAEWAQVLRMGGLT
ncbi:Predicted RNA-binding protein, contains PUA-like domain [Loktanella fryxellensis]|uniref:Predicted RNA-binding protein, contains PUA-like domain n=1 Tax=Loktanella fryxellensis TaxID=245187 RepID=A0A1H8DZD0_9RHOB|nr:EVE domain-containing protein [Loktanella fryxellensis]SEN12679.1 Predicted RNA-binding protein, contains PUA-like domain [Loktanella fryxellensis]